MIDITPGVTRQYVTFRVADLLLGVSVSKVQEVIRYQEMTVVPLAHSIVEGLINLRGQIVIAIDTRRSLGLPPSSSPEPPMNIVLHAPDGAVSLLVDEIHDVARIPISTCAAVPENMPARQRAMFQCVYDLPEGLMMALDTDYLLEIASQATLAFPSDSAEVNNLRAVDSRRPSHA